MIEHFLLSRLVGDLFADTDMAAWFCGVLEGTETASSEEQEFKFNMVDVIVDKNAGLITMRNCLDGDEVLEMKTSDVADVFRNLDALSGEVRTRVDQDFSQQREWAYSTLGQIHSYDADRLSSAALISAKGDIGKLKEAVELSQTDWRDLLVWTGLGDVSWRSDRKRLWQTGAD